MAFDLSSITHARQKPPIVLVYGDAGLGKTTFGCSAPNPIVIRTEDGLGMLETPCFPMAETFENVIEAIGTLYTESHDYQSVVIDSLDWLEPLIWRKVCQDHEIESIENLGYGKGYVEALNYWRKVVDGLRALRDQKNMIVIMTAHDQIVKVEDPVHPSYDMHTLKLHKKAGGLVLEASDIIGFAALKTMITTEDSGFGQKRSRAITTGDRVIHLVGQPAYVAKNRYGLPDVLPLSWAAVAEALTTARKD